MDYKDKAAPTAYEAPLHEDVWNSRGIAPLFLDFGITWRRVISFTPRLLCSRDKGPRYLL
jgi:hypothetical protein